MPNNGVKTPAKSTISDLLSHAPLKYTSRLCMVYVVSVKYPDYVS